MSLNEYEQNLEKFYKLKNKYYEKINREKQKLISNPDLSRKERRIKFNQTINMCINCKKKGGTIFEMNKDYYKVTCGNTEKPCNINIYFKRIHKTLMHDLLMNYLKDINNLKEKIIKIKLNYMLGFLSEEASIIQFTELKTELNTLYEKYKELLETYIKITNNIENKDEISKKNLEKQKYINEIKTKIEKYRFNNNSSEIKEIVEIYVNDLEKLVNDVRNIEYKNYYLYTDNEKNILVKDVFSLKDVETIIN